MPMSWCIPSTLTLSSECDLDDDSLRFVFAVLRFFRAMADTYTEKPKSTPADERNLVTGLSHYYNAFIKCISLMTRHQLSEGLAQCPYTEKWNSYTFLRGRRFETVLSVFTWRAL